MIKRLSLLSLAIAASAAEPAPKPIFESPSLTAKTSQRLTEIKADLKGAKELYLVVSDEGGNSCDWSDWLEPRLIMADGSSKDLTSLTWKSAKAGSG
ncbi:MAG: rane-bound dehydrogenase domain protein [Verrucomicrobiaceae bacterium]|nr:rane-bound dehydrogenase domain protein [Verrucomicrobiaceae bacterium]